MEVRLVGKAGVTNREFAFVTALKWTAAFLKPHLESTCVVNLNSCRASIPLRVVPPFQKGSGRGVNSTRQYSIGRVTETEYNAFEWYQPGFHASLDF